MRRARPLIVAVLALAAAAPAAHADFAPAQLVSASPALLLDGAADAAISADGRWVAFSGSLAGVSGVYRKDLATGALALVAGGDARAPSISADGRYLAFTTTAQLDATNDVAGGCPSVYVRDMTRAPGDAGADVLASALDGSSSGLAYAGSATAGCPGGGASAAARVALSADGRRVAFTVLGASNLQTGPGGATSAPPDQVLVRDLDTDATTLVSQTAASLGAAPAPVPGGAALANPAGGGTSTAALSADGTTVAWMGIDIPAQAAVAPGSAATQAILPVQYDEPLWRRIADGPAAPTRRVTGGDDPAACPSCAGPLVTSYDPQTTADTDAFPHTGSYVLSGTVGDVTPLTPALSGDGRTVAFLSTQPTPATAAALALSSNASVPSANAYVADMAPGLTRTQALTQLTAWAGFDFTQAASTGRVRAIAISSDGTHVALVTDRILFPLAQPALVTPQLNQAGAAQLYDVDLRAQTLALVTSGFDGQPANGDVAAPALSADGRTVAFASSASNLVYGAGAQGTSVFAIADATPPAIPGEQTSTPAPPPAKPASRWRISATVRHGAGGRLLLAVAVPGAGTLRVRAHGAVPLHRRVVARTILTAARATKRAGVLHLTLAPSARWDALIRSRAGLVATLDVAFAARGHRRLTQMLQASFHGRPPARKRRRA
jgi:WD40-like Beta Propeller Repeat